MLGLAQGMSPVELGLDLHQISCKPFLDKMNTRGWWSKNVPAGSDIDIVGGQ